MDLIFALRTYVGVFSEINMGNFIVFFAFRSFTHTDLTFFILFSKFFNIYMALRHL